MKNKKHILIFAALLRHFCWSFLRSLSGAEPEAEAAAEGAAEAAPPQGAAVTAATAVITEAAEGPESQV